MKRATTTAQIIVAVLFIISGLIKANDPLGLSYKMQEFFEIWNSSLASSTFFLKDVLSRSFSFLHGHSLALSIFMITLEVLTGIALLLGWRAKGVLNLLLSLIVFFTFLTGYAYWSGKFKNCGCFGDCLPITPLTSFLKDGVLLLLIIFLIAGQKYITSVLSSSAQKTIIISSLALTLLLQGYVLMYLPLVDCLPFKKGNSIAEQMKIPANAITDSLAIRFIYQKGGKEFEFSPQNLPADLGTYKFVKRIDKLVRQGNAEPPIKGFSLIGISGADSTEAVLSQQKALLVFCEYFAPNADDWITDFKDLNAIAKQKGIPVYMITTTVKEAIQLLAKNGLTDVPVFSCDNTAVRTAARTVPAVLLVNKGIVKQKYSYRQMNTITNEL